MMHYLRLSSALFFVLVFYSCSNSPYKHLSIRENTLSSVRFKPEYKKELYRCLVNGNIIFKKYHLSGLLIFKKNESGTVRAVFQNEIGITFFDFEWSELDSFKVNSIIDKLDKPVVVNTLRKDFEMLLHLNLDINTEKSYDKDGGEEVYSCYSIKEGSNCYIFKNNSLIRIENIGSKNIVTTVNIGNKEQLNSMPDSVFYNHHKANFTIQLTKIKTSAHVNE